MHSFLYLLQRDVQNVIVVQFAEFWICGRFPPQAVQPVNIFFPDARHDAVPTGIRAGYHRFRPPPA